MSPNKKVTKEVGIGEALTVKPIYTSSITQDYYLAFKPPSPMYPTRPPVGDWLLSKPKGETIRILVRRDA